MTVRVLKSSLFANSACQSRRHPFALKSRARGFAQHPFLLVLVFVFSVAAFLAYQQWQTTDGTPRGDVRIAELSGDDVGAETSRRDESSLHVIEDKASSNGAQSFFARLFGEEDGATTPLIEQAYAVPRYSPAEHVEWVDTFYTQLYSPEPSREVQEDEPVPIISGRVLTQYGTPVEGIEVTARFRDYFKTTDSIVRKNSVGTQKTTTDENGFYAFRGLPDGIYLVATKNSGYYAAARSEVHTGVKYADLVLNSQRYVQVRGIVTDPMRTEVDGVLVTPLVKGVPDNAVTDREGKFQLSVSLQGQGHSFPVRFQRQGYREQRYLVTENDLTEDGQLALDVTMEPVYEFTSLSGSVKGADDTHVSGERIRLFSPSLKRNYEVLVNDGGEFRFSKVEVAEDYRLQIHPTGPYRDYAAENLALTVGDQWHDIELEPLNRDYRLRGRILDQHDQPIPDFTLTLRSKSASGQRLAVTSDAYGRYEVADVPEGELVFESRTMPFYSVSGVHLLGNDTDRDLDLIVYRGQHKLIGKVVDNSGRPVTSPRIHISASTSKNGLRSQLSSTTNADYEGRFLFTDLGEGQHTVTVNAPGYEAVRVKRMVGNQNELVVQLEKNSI